jgi:hypothetical protein
MGYRVLAEATMIVHFAILGYLVFGGFLAWRWPRAIWPHLLMAAWGLFSTLWQWPCPMTALENWARRRAGEAGLGATGFIDHYLTGVVYPERYTVLVQVLAAIVVACSWVGAFGWRRHKRSGAGAAEVVCRPS